MLDFTPDDLARCLELASALRAADARARRSPHGGGAGRPAGRPAVREAVAAHPGHLHDWRRRAGRQHRRHPVRRDARRPRAAARRGAQSGALGRRAWSSARSPRPVCRSSPSRHPALRVVNALSDEEHPCQALADMQTLRERWGVDGRPYDWPTSATATTWPRRWCTPALMLGAHVRVATPKGYALPAEVAAAAERIARGRRRAEASTSIPNEAVKGADAVYTDVWTSMGQEVEYAERDQDLLALPGERRADGAGQARRDLHALPAGAPRPGSDRRGDRVAGLGRVRPGREPPARAEGHAGDAASRERRRRDADRPELRPR